MMVLEKSSVHLQKSAILYHAIYCCIVIQRRWYIDTPKMCIVVSLVPVCLLLCCDFYSYMYYSYSYVSSNTEVYTCSKMKLLFNGKAYAKRWTYLGYYELLSLLYSEPLFVDRAYNESWALASFWPTSVFDWVMWNLVGQFYCYNGKVIDSV